MLYYRFNIVPVNKHGVPLFDCTNGVPTCLKSSVYTMESCVLQNSIFLEKAREEIRNIIQDGTDCYKTTEVIGINVLSMIHDTDVAEVFVAFEIGSIAFIPFNMKLRDHFIVKGGTEDVRMACSMIASIYNKPDIEVTDRPYTVTGIVVDTNGKTLLRNIGGIPDVFRSPTVVVAAKSEADILTLAKDMISECLATSLTVADNITVLGRIGHDYDGRDTFRVVYKMTELDYLKVRTFPYIEIEDKNDDREISCIMRLYREHKMKNNID